MPQSLTQLYVHIVFSTKYRQPLISDEVKESLYQYLGGICRELECYPIKVGGYYDHVHILCSHSRKITLMKLLEEVKKSSSKWMKTKGDDYAGFYWQDGYAAFSVSHSKLQVVSDYISNQYAHHSSQSFQNECRTLLKNHDIDFDEKHLWE